MSDEATADSIKPSTIEPGTLKGDASDKVYVDRSEVFDSAKGGPFGEVESTLTKGQLDLFAGEPEGYRYQPETVTYGEPVSLRPQVVRHPNLVDAFLFGVLMMLGLLVTTGVLGLFLHFHWFGLKTFAEAQNDTRLALGTQLSIYLIGLAGAIPFFQVVWGKGFFESIHWHRRTAVRQFKWLIITAVVCNVIAMVGNVVLPFPEHAPIDKMFSTPTDAWLLFVFGVTIAPFFEEMIFRGFLLPAMATAWDWCVERLTAVAPKPLDSAGNPEWSRGAMIFAAIVVSAPFALMHSAQVGSAWGPVSLLYCVSLILCAVRLMTRSLAASTVVHSAYNFMLFAVMLVETDGFRHLDKM